MAGDPVPDRPNIIGSRRSFRFSQSSAPRSWCAGIGPAFAAIGARNYRDGEGDRRLMQTCVG